MEWIIAHSGDILVIGLIVIATAAIVLNLLKKKNPCGSCTGCTHQGCPGRN